MATPKLDQISVDFSYLIPDPVASASTDGSTLSALQRMEYINDALFILFNEYWEAVKGNVKDFIQIFPELFTVKTVSTDADGKYVIADPNLDFKALVSGRVISTNKQIVPKDKNLYHVYVTGSHPHYAPTASKPVMIEISGTVYFFPEADLDSLTSDVEIAYIKQPLNPANGSFLTQGGSYDSPFSSQWNSKIVELAVRLYKADVQD